MIVMICACHDVIVSVFMDVTLIEILTITIL